MDFRRKALLCFTFYSFLLTLMRFRQRVEEERVARRRRGMFFLRQLQLQHIAFISRLGRRNCANRRCWQKERSDDWWERIVQNNFTEEDWLNNFRMTSSTFQFICRRLKPYLKPSNHCVREPTSVEKKVAITLYKLASCAEYRVVANQFGTTKSAVHNYVYDVCEALYSEFKNDYLTVPNEVEAEEIADGFEKMCGIPNVIGAIDGTHIQILPPKDGYSDFINRKGWPSYNMMAVVDHLYRFRYATCQHPGNSHDAAVLKDSTLFKFSDNILPKRIATIEGTEIPCMLLGDPAYPLLPWLLKGYKGNLTPEEESFNVYLNRGRVVVENAFGRLKARFRCLSKRVDIHYTFVPKVVAACLVLHNIIETRKDRFQQFWLDSLREAELMFPQPQRNISRDFDSIDASRVRDTLKNYMTRFPPRTSKLS